MRNYCKKRFEDKIMLVTGAARGIGKAVALRAAQEGAKLVLSDKNEAEGNAVCQEIRAAGESAVFIPLDLSSEEGAKAMVDRAVSEYGRIDIAINNTGIMGNPAPAHKLEKEQMELTMTHNFYSVFFCCKHELQQFIKQKSGGAIVNNASIAGLTGLPGSPAYVASKHALNGLTKNLAIDYAKFGIRVNSINPAPTKTPMREEANDFVRQCMEEAQKSGAPINKTQTMGGMKTASLLMRDAEAEEQAAAILFLASEDASYMTGATMQTDGGWTSY